MSLTYPVLVKFFGFLEHLAGQRQITVEAEEGWTVQDLLARLGAQYGARFASHLFRTPAEVHSFVRVFVNNEECGPPDRILKDGTRTSEVVVLLLPAMEGGSRG